MMYGDNIPLLTIMCFSLYSIFNGPYVRILDDPFRNSSIGAVYVHSKPLIHIVKDFSMSVSAYSVFNLSSSLYLEGYHWDRAVLSASVGEYRFIGSVIPSQSQLDHFESGSVIKICLYGGSCTTLGGTPAPTPALALLQPLLLLPPSLSLFQTVLQLSILPT